MILTQHGISSIPKSIPIAEYTILPDSSYGEVQNGIFTVTKNGTGLIYGPLVNISYSQYFEFTTYLKIAQLVPISGYSDSYIVNRTNTSDRLIYIHYESGGLIEFYVRGSNNSWNRIFCDSSSYGTIFKNGSTIKIRCELSGLCEAYIDGTLVATANYVPTNNILWQCMFGKSTDNYNPTFQTGDIIDLTKTHLILDGVKIY